ncbi:MAG: putative glycolipid-binding domain-containing protein [Acidobacteriota bacterium]
MTDQSILWRRLDQPGHEYSRLYFLDSCWHLNGAAVFAYDQQPCWLDYLVVCDSQWQTISGKVNGWVANRRIEIELYVDSSHHWQLNGRECREVAGCIDLDLNFSPSTNLLPIRRLSLARQQEAEVKAAWLRFPSFTLEPLSQVYQRIDESTYRYISAGGSFIAELRINRTGFVTHYADLWQVEGIA